MIHTYALNGCNFAVDGNSGSIHILDDLSYDILRDHQELPSIEETISHLGKRYDENDIREGHQEIEMLREQGLLFTRLQCLDDILTTKEPDYNLKALCLHISHDCNLRCEYCFASKGDYHSGRRLMSREVAIQAVDYLVENSKGRRNIEIDFFGGEPLMNFDTVTAVVDYGKKIEQKTGKSFYFTITTNGTLLDKQKIDFINEYMDNVVISIDGRKDIHDAVRHDKAGHGSYNRILPLARELVAGRSGKSYFIRGTFTSKNKDFSNDVFHLADLGFQEISVEPVVGTGDNLFFSESDIPDLLNEYERFALQYLERLSKGKYFRFYHFSLDLYKGPCLYKRMAACGAGFEYLAVSPDGNLFPCHQFVGQEEFILGNVFCGVNNSTLVECFQNCNINSKTQCRDCWAKLFCSGGCHANAWYTNGTIMEPNEMSCILMKKRIECAIMIQALMHSNSDELKIKV